MLQNAKFREIRKVRENRKELNVVITGGSRGFGRHLAEEFANKNHRVVTISRLPVKGDGVVYWNHVIADVSSAKQLSHAFDDAMFLHGDTIDIWINNAAISGGYKSFVDFEEKDMQDIVGTNLLAPMLFTKKSFDIMSLQKTGGDIYNIVGAGSNGKETPNFALYGTTKAAIKQFSKTLHKEFEHNTTKVHLISPGMMNTDLLMNNLPLNIKDIITPFISKPELVAKDMIDRIIQTYYDMPKKQKHLEYMTIPRMISNIFDHIIQKNI
jgi:chlorophyll(ide) b reductase